MYMMAVSETPASARLSRPSVLGAALELVDREGLQALTVRRLAEHLGVSPMAIYNHVRGKQALLDGIADLVAREIETPPQAWPWRKRLIASLKSTRRACLAHPNAIPLVQTTRLATPALLGPAEEGLDALADGGFEPDAALEAWAALIALTMGHLTYQLNHHLSAAVEPPVPIPSTKEFPRITAALSATRFDFDHAFDTALEALLTGLARSRDRTRGDKGSRLRPGPDLGEGG